jgi:hypothetical protein
MYISTLLLYAFVESSQMSLFDDVMTFLWYIIGFVSASFWGNIVAMAVRG